MHFYIPATRTTAHCASRALDRSPECGHHFFAHLLDEFTRECSLASNDSITLESFNFGIDAAGQNAFSTSMQCHMGPSTFLMRRNAQSEYLRFSARRVAKGS